MLLHHGLPFEEKPHMPLIGELALRARARRWRGRVSVPLLVDGKTSIVDSLAIAEHVDRLGSSLHLLPDERLADIRRLNATVEPIFQAGRARAIQVVLTDDDAARAALPPPLRSLPLSPSMARLGSHFLTRKYAVSFDRARERMQAGLHEIRRTLSGRPYVYDRFSYADIICATALHFIDPVDQRYVSIEAAIRRTWSQPELAKEFADLVSWRNAVYAQHRPVA
jgi:glutathione S-transferase